MMGNKVEKVVIPNLIEIYSLYLSHGINDEVTEKAKNLYERLTTAGPLLTELVESSLNKLFFIAYPNVDLGIKIPSKKEVKDIISKLNKRKQELEK